MKLYILLQTLITILFCSCVVNRDGVQNVGGTQINMPTDFKTYENNITIVNEGDKIIYLPNSSISNYSPEFIDQSIKYHEQHLQNVRDDIVKIEADSIENKSNLAQGKIGPKKYSDKKKDNDKKLNQKRATQNKFENAYQKWQSLQTQKSGASEPLPKRKPSGLIKAKSRTNSEYLAGGSYLFKPEDVGFSFDIVIHNETKDYPSSNGSFFANPLRACLKISYFRPVDSPNNHRNIGQ